MKGNYIFKKSIILNRIRKLSLKQFVTNSILCGHSNLMAYVILLFLKQFVCQAFLSLLFLETILNGWIIYHFTKWKSRIYSICLVCKCVSYVKKVNIFNDIPMLYQSLKIKKVKCKMLVKAEMIAVVAVIVEFLKRLTQKRLYVYKH